MCDARYWVRAMVFIFCAFGTVYDRRVYTSTHFASGPLRFNSSQEATRTVHKPQSATDRVSLSILISTNQVRFGALIAWVEVRQYAVFPAPVAESKHADTNGETSLAPLRGLFPALRLLYLSFTTLQDSEVFGLICSFPRLEDLTLYKIDALGLAVTGPALK